jgi:hypothetical protein
MHQVHGMSRRSHRSLRLGALALLVCAAMWPRAKAGMTAAELANGSHGSARTALSTHSVAARAETTAAKLVSPPHTSKLAVAEANEANRADESALSY